MKPNTTNRLKSLALVSLLTVAGVGVTPAQNLLVNGDFTANAAGFTTWPGYTAPWSEANPAGITAWGNFFGTPVGINGAGTVTSVFGPVNDGGLTYAFIQNGMGMLMQGMPGGYIPGMTYDLSFDAAARSGETGVSFRVQIGDATQIHVTTLVGATELIGNDAAFTHYNYLFTAPASFNGAPSIQLYNLTSGAGTINFANVSVAVVPEPTSAALAIFGLVLARCLRRRAE